MLKKKRSFFIKISILLIIDAIFLVYYQYTSKTLRAVHEGQVKLSKNTAESLKNHSDCVVLKQTCKCQEHMNIILCRSDGKYFSYISNDVTRFIRMRSKIDEAKLDTARFTCGLQNLLKRGQKQKVMAYSLYGLDQRYYEKLKTISRQIKYFYPDWVMRVYHDDSIDQNIACEMQCSMHDSNVDFCNVNQLYMSKDDYLAEKPFDVGYLHGMMWRWLPFGDDFVDVFSSRDADSLITNREVDVVKVWLKSGLYGHLMRDSPLHTAIMMGGLFDINSTANRDLSAKIYQKVIDPAIAELYNKNKANGKGEDQHFLAEHVYSSIRNVSIYHDSYKCKETGGIPWPSKRKGNCFVGSDLICYPYSDKPNLSQVPDCPVECRPTNQKGWVKC